MHLLNYKQVPLGMQRSPFRSSERGPGKQVTFFVDLALPRSVQEARTKSPKTAASTRDGGCAPRAQVVSSIAFPPPSFQHYTPAFLSASLWPCHITARLIVAQHAFAIKVARLRSVAQSRSVLPLTIQIQIPLPFATSLSVPRLSISPTSS